MHSLVSELPKCMAGGENCVIEGTLQCSPGQPKQGEGSVPTEILILPQHQSLQWTGSVGDGKPLPG